MVDYEEYYSLTDGQYKDFLNNGGKAAEFADECRQRRHDPLLILKPSAHRHVAI
jgi:hypothetical protein